MRERIPIAVAVGATVALLAGCTAGPAPAPENSATSAATEWPEQTGAGVTTAIADRGIDWRHEDFRNEDGSTRIHSILDLSGQNWCTEGNPPGTVYTAAQIDAALRGEAELDHRDAVGHGTATAGMAAGDGSSLPGAPWRGVAPEATLVIVKAASEGAAGPEPEQAFNGCITQAMQWLDATLTEIGQPAVGLWNTGVQWGPIDGTSAVSREIAAVFGPDRPGRIWVVSSGDEGSVPNHAGADLGTEPVQVRFTREAGRDSYPTAWYSGETPTEITLSFDDGTVVGPVGPGQSVQQHGVIIQQLQPGAEFYPWTSSSGDRAVWMRIGAERGDGTLSIRALDGGTGHVDVYGDMLGSEHLTSSIEFIDHLVDGRLTDQASTEGVIVAGVHVVRDSWTSLDGRQIDRSAEGSTGQLWLKSSGGPTRDGRLVVDVTAAGQNAYAALGADSAWSRIPAVIPAEGEGFYVVFGGTSAAAPMVAGAVALLLELDPALTATEAREVLRATADGSHLTGPLPDPDWGYGKLDLLAAVAQLE